MDKTKVDSFVLANQDLFSTEDIPVIRLRLESADDDQWGILSTLSFKDPQTALMLSIFGSPIGADRFYIGDYLLGVFKTITCGGIFIWAFIDMFLIKKATRENNMKMFTDALNC